MIIFSGLAKFNKTGAVIFLTQDQVKSNSYTFKNNSVSGILRQLVKVKGFGGENGEIFPVADKNRTLVFAGLGEGSELTPTALRIAVKKVLLSRYLKNVDQIEIVPPAKDDVSVRAVIDGIMIGTYKWQKYLTEDKSKSEALAKKYYLAVEDKASCRNAITIAEGVNFTRDLINENADTANSAFLEKKVRELVRGNKKISLEILNKKEMEKVGLGLHLAVNQGSPNEPKLIIVKYAGGGSQEKYTALIGKGMTFDTGGLNLKPTGHMETMRIDMSGAAAVIGTLKNAIALNLKKNVIFAMAVAENCIGSRAYKPGDVFKSYNGKTVEIGNTDAEGRLVLADAISYIVRNYKPARIVDIATLTGACVVALGYDYTGLVTTDDVFSRHLIHSSNVTDDRAWRLPSYVEIKEAVKSPIADIKNVGFPKGAAGALTAAEFLRQFTEDTPWAHLDIAGTAYVDGQDRWYFNHGATGAGVRLLSDYLLAN